MPGLFFIRHGESEANAAGLVTGQAESPLTEHGSAQAHQAVEWATEQALQFDAVLVSPLERAMTTAHILTGGLHIPQDKVVIVPDLIERGCGDFEGKPVDTFYEAPESTSVRDHGVEPLDALYIRATRVLETVHTEYAGENVLLVSHNAFGKMLRLVVEGRDASEFDKTISLPHATIMRLEDL